MYRPRELIFAPTGRCNLHCRHCRVDRGRGELDIGAALAFLADCAGHGVERLGFSGGEPFLRPDFLEALVRAAVDQGLLFDRLMTNGVWWQDESQLRDTMEAVAEAGFDGVVGLSVDDWHGQDPARLATFLGACFAATGRRDVVEIASVLDDAGKAPVQRLEALASALGGRLKTEDGLPAAIVDRADPDEEARASGVALLIRIIVFPRSHGAAEDSWNSPDWFMDDRCEGPGQVLYVHPDGQVAVCCGFANERPELSLGHVEAGYEALLAAAARRPQVQTCYGEGLSAYRARLEAAGVALPGRTSDQCFFCDWVCEKGLIGRN